MIQTQTGGTGIDRRTVIMEQKVCKYETQRDCWKRIEAIAIIPFMRKKDPDIMN